jgi:exosortase family protein XrtF
LKKYFEQYRPFFIFLLKFFGVYVALTLVYQWYLSKFDGAVSFEVDGFTQTVAHQVQWVLQFLNYDCTLLPHEHQASVKLILNQVYVSRVVEGCNALSVMILFVAFVIAFSGKWKHTIGFIVFGIVLIHMLNVLRIALLSLALFYHPEQEPILHGVVFPLFIYGVVFGLWVIWVNKFSKYARKTASK